MRPIKKNPFCRFPSCHDPNPKKTSHSLIMYITWEVKIQVFSRRTETSPTTFRHILSNNLLLPAAIEDSMVLKQPNSNQPSTLEPSLPTAEPLKIQNNYTPEAWRWNLSILQNHHLKRKSLLNKWGCTACLFRHQTPTLRIHGTGTIFSIEIN